MNSIPNPAVASIALLVSLASAASAQVSVGVPIPPVPATARFPMTGEIRVDCGGAFYVSSAQEPWRADYGFVGGAPAAHAGPIAGTPDPVLHQTSRRGASFAYALPIAPGVYDVTLRFADTASGSVGDRVFDVRCEGVLELDDLDVYALAGAATAYSRTIRTQVLDGRVDLDFVASLGTAHVAAIEVRSPKILTLTPDQLDFGTIALGLPQVRNLVLENRGLHAIHLQEVEFENVAGAGHDFRLDVAGQGFEGDHQDIQFPLLLTIPKGGSVAATVTYTPTEHVPNEVLLRFAGDFEAGAEVELQGSGGTGDPFLHAVALVEPVTVDYDDDGFETVELDGSDSHTHELGHALASWTWREGTTTIGSGAVIAPSFPTGPHSVSLEIGDDNQPPRTLTTHASFDVVAPQAVPGILAHWYATPGADPVPLLAAPPTNADQATILPALAVAPDTSIGGAITPGHGMVRLRGDLSIAVSGTYAFTLNGGAQSVLRVDGQVAGATVALSAGKHALDARFAVTGVDDLPLEVLLGNQISAPEPIDAALLTHDESNVLPVINAMPDDGLQTGGYPVVIDGFGFFPRADVSIEWGSTTIVSTSFTSWKPGRVEFQAPPGSGTVQVRVRNGAGVSDLHLFTYSSNGSVPIVFTAKPPVAVNDPTCAEWGPDGRLYVGTLSGEIKAITFDANYAVTGVATYPGVSALGNPNVLGIAFSPWDAPGTVRVYVAHTKLYQNGGGAFTGPSYYVGAISRLAGPTFDAPEIVVAGLPSSNRDHGVNGIVFDDNGDLLIAVGGNTNAGVRHPNLGDLPESPLSCAIAVAPLSSPSFDGMLSYGTGRLGQPQNDQVFGESVDLVRGDVRVRASGFRNAYDLVLTTKNLLYATDNGPNFGYGAASTGLASQASDPQTADELLLVERENYYGHPNRNRARNDPRQAVYRRSNDPAIPDLHTRPLVELPSSCDGIVEYRANAFAGALRGQLLVQKWDDSILRVRLRADGRAVEEVAPLNPLVQALDLTTGPGGALLAIDYTHDKVTPLVPNDAAATGLSVYEITPWRAPAAGGTTFTIGGSGFGTLPTTTVTIGGVTAQLTSVTPTRITGTIPANPPGAGTLQAVVVATGQQVASVPGAFRALAPTGHALGTWTTGPQMPESLGEVAGGVINGVLYLVGEGSNRTLACSLLNPGWINTLTPRPRPGHHHAAETYGEKLYLIGGLDGASEGKVQIYDPATNSWSFGPDMPWPGGAVSTCLIGAKIYAAGGIVGSTTVDSCAVYDILANSWTMRAPMPFQQGRNHAAAGTDGSRFYVFGGQRQRTILG